MFQTRDLIIIELEMSPEKKNISSKHVIYLIFLRRRSTCYYASQNVYIYTSKPKIII